MGTDVGRAYRPLMSFRNLKKGNGAYLCKRVHDCIASLEHELNIRSAFSYIQAALRSC
jgi:hypothetical protein